MDPDRLADRAEEFSRATRVHAGLTWERVQAWETARMPSRGERGGGMADGETDDRIDDRREDAAASRYRAEVAKLTQRLEADMARLQVIYGICNPTPPKNLSTRDMQLAQVAADGWCVSCWRDDQDLTPVSDGRYRDRCRFCGDWRGEHGADPPVAILRMRHSGRRITIAAVAKEMAK